MHVQAHTLGHPIAALTPAVQMKPQTVLNVVVEIAVRLTRIAEAEISGPALQILIQIRNQIRDRFKAKPAAGHSPQRCPFLLHGLLRGDHIQITMPPAMPIQVVSKRVSQKIQAGTNLLEFDNPRFFPVEFQSHPLFQFRFDELGDLGAPLIRQNYKIIRVSDQFRVRPLPRSIRSMKHLIEPVQINIR